MKKIMNHKITRTSYYVMSNILMVCFVLAVIYIILKYHFIFFLPGFLLSIILTVLVIRVLENHKKEKLSIVRKYQKFNFIFYIIALASILLLILSINEVYYRVNHYLFPQAIGMDQTAYLRNSAPLIYLSYFAMIENIISCFILFSLPKHKVNSITNSSLAKSVEKFNELWSITDINKILEIEDKNSLVIALYGYLCSKSSYGEMLDKLTLEEITIFLCQDIEAEINNGGFSQFIYNSSGNHTHETLEALKAINAFKTASLVEKVISIFPNHQVPKDRNKRQEIFKEIYDKNDVKDLLKEIDNVFYEYEDDLEDLKFRYIVSNKSKFV